MSDDLPDPQEYAEALVDGGKDGAIVLAADPEGTDIGAHVGDTDGHPAETTLWMLAAHIYHIRQSAHGAGGNATVEDIVQESLEMLKRSVEEPDHD